MFFSLGKDIISTTSATAKFNFFPSLKLNSDLLYVAPTEGEEINHFVSCSMTTLNPMQKKETLYVYATVSSE